MVGGALAGHSEPNNEESPARPRTKKSDYLFDYIILICFSLFLLFP